MCQRQVGGFTQQYGQKTAWDLGNMYAKLITTAEMYHAKNSREGMDQSEVKKYVGRAKGVVFKIKDRMEEPRKNKGLPANACSPMVQWWAMLTSRVGLLVKLRKRKRRREQIDGLVGTIRNSVTSLPEGLEAGYYASDKKQVMPTREGWKKKLEEIGTSDEAELERIEKEACTMHRRSVNLKIKEAKQGFIAWITEHAKPENSHAAIFGWVKKRLPPPAATIWTCKRVIVEPLKVLQYRKEQWEG